MFNHRCAKNHNHFHNWSATFPVVPVTSYISGKVVSSLQPWPIEKIQGLHRPKKRVVWVDWTSAVVNRGSRWFPMSSFIGFFGRRSWSKTFNNHGISPAVGSVGSKNFRESEAPHIQKHRVIPKKHPKTRSFFFKTIFPIMIFPVQAVTGYGQVPAPNVGQMLL